MEVITKKVGRGRKYHSFEVKRPEGKAAFHMAYSLCGLFNPHRRGMVELQHTPPPSLADVCGSCQRIERVRALKEKYDYERGVRAYSGISEELSCFGMGPDHDKCYGQCKLAKPEDFEEWELAWAYATKEQMPWPPCDVDTLHQQYPEHVELERKIWAEHGAANN